MLVLACWLTVLITTLIIITSAINVFSAPDICIQWWWWTMSAGHWSLAFFFSFLLSVWPLFVPCLGIGSCLLEVDRALLFVRRVLILPDVRVDACWLSFRSFILKMYLMCSWRFVCRNFLFTGVCRKQRITHIKALTIMEGDRTPGTGLCCNSKALFRVC